MLRWPLHLAFRCPASTLLHEIPNREPRLRRPPSDHGTPATQGPMRQEPPKKPEGPRQAIKLHNVKSHPPRRLFVPLPSMWPGLVVALHCVHPIIQPSLSTLPDLPQALRCTLTGMCTGNRRPHPGCVIQGAAPLHKGGGKPEDEVASFRPITLLNTDVKLLARVLVGRMSAGLDVVVDTTQTAFIPGRWIGDNVLFHLEEIDY